MGGPLGSTIARCCSSRSVLRHRHRHHRAGQPASRSSVIRQSAADHSDELTREEATVQTQRGVPNLRPRKKKGVKPQGEQTTCEECGGTGVIRCPTCEGWARENYKGVPLLPKGVYPDWCRYCKATGTVTCFGCLGSGIPREPIGFRV